MTPELGEAIRAGVGALLDALAPWAAGTTYLDFTERREDARAFYAPATSQRLREVKAQFDAGELFPANHPMPPASAPRPEGRRIGRAVRIRSHRASTSRA